MDAMEADLEEMPPDFAQWIDCHVFTVLGCAYAHAASAALSPSIRSREAGEHTAGPVPPRPELTITESREATHKLFQQAGALSSKDGGEVSTSSVSCRPAPHPSGGDARGQPADNAASSCGGDSRPQSDASGVEARWPRASDAADVPDTLAPVPMHLPFGQNGRVEAAVAPVNNGNGDGVSSQASDAPMRRLDLLQTIPASDSALRDSALSSEDEDGKGAAPAHHRVSVDVFATQAASPRVSACRSTAARETSNSNSTPDRRASRLVLDGGHQSPDNATCRPIQATHFPQTHAFSPVRATTRAATAGAGGVSAFDSRAAGNSGTVLATQSSGDDERLVCADVVGFADGVPLSGSPVPLQLLPQGVRIPAGPDGLMYLCSLPVLMHTGDPTSRSRSSSRSSNVSCGASGRSGSSRVPVVRDDVCATVLDTSAHHEHLHINRPSSAHPTDAMRPVSLSSPNHAGGTEIPALQSHTLVPLYSMSVAPWRETSQTLFPDTLLPSDSQLAASQGGSVTINGTRADVGVVPSSAAFYDIRGAAALDASAAFDDESLGHHVLEGMSQSGAGTPVGEAHLQQYTQAHGHSPTHSPKRTPEQVHVHTPVGAGTDIRRVAHASSSCASAHSPCPTCGYTSDFPLTQQLEEEEAQWGPQHTALQPAHARHAAPEDTPIIGASGSPIPTPCAESMRVSPSLLAEQQPPRSGVHFQESVLEYNRDEAEASVHASGVSSHQLGDLQPPAYPQSFAFDQDFDLEAYNDLIDAEEEEGGACSEDKAVEGECVARANATDSLGIPQVNTHTGALSRAPATDSGGSCVPAGAAVRVNSNAMRTLQLLEAEDAQLQAISGLLIVRNEAYEGNYVQDKATLRGLTTGVQGTGLSAGATTVSPPWKSTLTRTKSKVVSAVDATFESWDDDVRDLVPGTQHHAAAGVSAVSGVGARMPIGEAVFQPLLRPRIHMNQLQPLTAPSHAATLTHTHHPRVHPGTAVQETAKAGLRGATLATSTTTTTTATTITTRGDVRSYSPRTHTPPPAAAISGGGRSGGGGVKRYEEVLKLEGWGGDVTQATMHSPSPGSFQPNVSQSHLPHSQLPSYTPQEGMDASRGEGAGVHSQLPIDQIELIEPVDASAASRHAPGEARASRGHVSGRGGVRSSGITSDLSELEPVDSSDTGTSGANAPFRHSDTPVFERAAHPDFSGTWVKDKPAPGASHASAVHDGASNARRHSGGDGEQRRRGHTKHTSRRESHPPAATVEPSVAAASSSSRAGAPAPPSAVRLNLEARADAIAKALLVVNGRRPREEKDVTPSHTYRRGNASGGGGGGGANETTCAASAGGSGLTRAPDAKRQRAAPPASGAGTGLEHEATWNRRDKHQATTAAAAAGVSRRESQQQPLVAPTSVVRRKSGPFSHSLPFAAASSSFNPAGRIGFPVVSATSTPTATSTGSGTSTKPTATQGFGGSSAGVTTGSVTQRTITAFMR